MKTKKNNLLLTNLYNTHATYILNRNNKNYLKLFEHYNDLLSNVKDEDLQNELLYSHIKIESFLFDSIISTSKDFYELAFNDLKQLLFTEQKIDNSKKQRRIL